MQLLYDIINLNPTTIIERNSKKDTATDQRRSEVSRNAVSIDNVPQSGTTVKNSIRGEAPDNSGEGELFDAAPAGTKGDRRSQTGISLKPRSQYSAKDNEIIDGYIEAVDSNVYVIAEIYRKNKSAPNKRIKVADVHEQLAKDIQRIIGIDVSGYSIWADKSTFTHIEKRHGTNGAQDRSMANLNDIARMGFVITNYDSIEWCLNQNGERVYSKYHNGANGHPAPILLIKKKINGTYYLSEAAADNAYRKLWVESAYINKGVTQATTADGQVDTSETSLASPPNSSIRNSSEKINLSAQDTEANATAESNINAEPAKPVELAGTRKAYKRRHA